MKNKITFVFAILFLVSGFAMASKLVGVRGETIDEVSARKKWGSSTYSGEAFKKGSLSERASMAASLLAEKSKFIGLDRLEIRRRLGDFSGYYFSGMYPTYLIQETSDTSSEAWQIVFLIDNSGKIVDVVIHKNCCS